MNDVMQIHGWGSSPKVWDRLKRKYLIRSPRFEKVTKTDEFFDATIRALPKTPTILIGWSMGGMLALETAIRAPEKVAAMILVGTSPKFVDPDKKYGWPVKNLRLMKVALKKNLQNTMRRFTRGMFTQNESKELREYELRFGTIDAIDFDEKSLMTGLDYLIQFDVSKKLERIQCPTLWIHGECDEVCPKECLRFIPKTHDCIIIPNTGHAPHWSRPTIVNHEMDSFLNDLHLR